MKIISVHYKTNEDIYLLGVFDSMDKTKKEIALNLINREIVNYIGSDQQDIKEYIEENYMINEIELNQVSNEYISYY